MNSPTRLLATLALLASTSGFAADFPTKPVRLVVGFAPGGASDIVARLLEPEVSKRLGQPLVIDNKPGANGNIANEIAAKAEPDGHTLLLGNPGPLVLNPYIYKSVSVDPAKAFVPVTQLTESPLVVVVPANSPIKTLQDLIAKAKKSPNGVTYGSAGNGSSMHVAGATLQAAIGAPMVHVPYKGSGPALIDLLGGTIDFMPDSRSTTMPHIRDGRLRPLAVTGTKRVADLPNVPTVAEAGVPGFNVTTWLGIVAPAGTPPAAVRRLHDAFTEALKVPAVQQRFAELATNPTGTTPEAFAKLLDDERRAAKKLVAETRMSID
jgi:tripartite-type tricarboxylate transporter receptor subunit TctC